MIQHVSILILIFTLFKTYNKSIQHNQIITEADVNVPTNQVRPFDQYIYTWWTDISNLSPNRKKNLNTIKNSQLKVIYITLQNYQHFVLDDHPIHQSFEFLSAIQKGDYFKGYFMHIYGGAYSDLKDIQNSYRPARDKLRQNIDLYGVGYFQHSPGDVSTSPDDTQFIKFLRTDNNYKKYIGNGCYIFRPMEDFTLQWYNRMIAKMEQKKQLFKIYPARNSRQKQSVLYPYPNRWGQLNGEIFAKVQYMFPDTVSDGIPYVNMKNYR